MMEEIFNEGDQTPVDGTLSKPYCTTYLTNFANWWQSPWLTPLIALTALAMQLPA